MRSVMIPHRKQTRLLGLLVGVLIAFGLLTTSSVHAQASAGEIEGKVVNQLGNPIEGVTVINASSLKKSKRTQSTTDKDGNFKISANKGDTLLLSCIGYKERKVRFDGDLKTAIRLEGSSVALEAVEVEADIKSPMTSIDMTHKSHLTLSQALEGGVAGLTLRQSTSVTQDIGQYQAGGFMGATETWNLISQYDPSSLAALAAIGNVYTLDDYKRYIANTPGADPAYETSFQDNGLVPELRGGNSFLPNSNGMLIVVDGFPQDDFPADMPMSNVKDIQVIKDPIEAAKWGPKAAGGVILITTTMGEKGKFTFDYSGGISFSPKPNISSSKMHLATTSQVLDGYKEMYDKGFFPGSTAPSEGMMVRLLLGQLREGNITQAQFDQSWDSLSMLNNRSQLPLLQQNVFRQNHSLTMSRGWDNYQFSLNGVFQGYQTSRLNNDSKTAQLNWKNRFSFLDDRLRINFNVLYQNKHDIFGTSENGFMLMPYQMLLNEDGSYAYDYSNFGTVLNSQMLAYNPSYLDNGVNLVENAKANEQLNKTNDLNSNLDIQWNVAPGFNWTTSVLYSYQRLQRNTTTGAASSTARRLFNQYGVYRDADYNILPDLEFLVPYGAIFDESESKLSSFSVRSGLGLDKIFGKHRLQASAGIALQGNHTDAPMAPARVYGINDEFPKGQPVTIPSDDFSFYDFANGQHTAIGLLLRSSGFKTDTRQFNVNGSVGYTFDERYTLQGYINSAFTPLYSSITKEGNKDGYLPLYIYGSNLSWHINKEKFFPHSSLVNDLTLSAVFNGIQLPSVSDIVSGTRSLQDNWSNEIVVPSFYTISQWTGQTSNNYGGELALGLDSNRFRLTVGYNRPSITRGGQWTGRLNYDLRYARFMRIPSVISTLNLFGILRQQDPYQVLATQLSTNMTPPNGGNYSMTVYTLNQDYSLPQGIKYLNVGFNSGFFKDRLLLSANYYQRTSSGISANQPIIKDPAGGMGTPLFSSAIRNTGVELYIKGDIIKTQDFGWSMTFNGAYNRNVALRVPEANYSSNVSFLTLPVSGRSVDAIYSYDWAGLDEHGNPQIFNAKKEKVGVADTTVSLAGINADALVYSGVLRAPYSGALIPEWRYKGIFASMRFIFSYGAVMRRYIPIIEPSISIYNDQIASRWQQPGDELITDVPVAGKVNVTRKLVTQNSSNSIVSADFVRLREIQLGYDFSKQFLEQHMPFFNALTFSAQANNVAVWVKNKYHLDPDFTTSLGTPVPGLPVQYSFTLNASF